MVIPGPGVSVSAVDGVQAVVLDGDPVGLGPELARRVRDRVESGLPLLAFGAVVASATTGDDARPWVELLGALALPALVETELFVTVVDAADPLTRRLPPELAVVDRLLPLQVCSPGPTSLVRANVGYHEIDAVVGAPVGAGRVVVSGLGGTEAALAHPDLRRLLRRALQPVPRRSMPERTLGLAVVGYGAYGGMGQIHGRAASAVAGLELVAAVDNRPERRKAAEQDFPGAWTGAGVAELLRADDVDVVVVATPPSSHAVLGLQLLRAGKHVVCEKPMCLTVAEADSLVATARVEGRMLTVNQNRRWDSDYLAVRRAVGTGRLGEVFNLETFVGGFEHPCRAWHSEVSVSGGAVYDWGSHHVDWILQLMGSAPERVTTTSHKRVWHDVTNADQVRVHLDWDDGREAEFVQSDVAAVRRPKFYVQGTAGTLVGHYRPLSFERVEPVRGYVREQAHHAEAPAELMLAQHEAGYALSEARLALAPEQPFAFHRNLADHLLGSEALAVTPESVRHVVAVLEAAQTFPGQGPVELAGEPRPSAGG